MSEVELEQLTPKWETCLQFPDCISSEGRARLHEVSNYFGLGNHSGGRKGKSRHFILYPKTLFTDKQRSEKARLEREKAKLIEKFSQKDALIG